MRKKPHRIEPTFISDLGSMGRSALSRTIRPLPNTLSSQTAKLIPAVLGTCTEMITLFIYGRLVVVEVFGGPRQVGDGEANLRIAFAGMHSPLAVTQRGFFQYAPIPAKSIICSPWPRLSPYPFLRRLQMKRQFPCEAVRRTNHETSKLPWCFQYSWKHLSRRSPAPLPEQAIASGAFLGAERTLARVGVKQHLAQPDRFRRNLDKLVVLDIAEAFSSVI